jgi:heat shock protein HtpX
MTAGNEGPGAQAAGGGGRNFRLRRHIIQPERNAETTMSITRTRIATQARTWVIISALTALFVGLGYLFGGSSGLILFAGIAIVFNLVMFWFSDRLALKASRARPVERSEAPELYRDIEEIAATAGLPMPRVYLIPSEQPNAFATGRSPKKAAVAVTEGLLRYLPREQVRGVLAHELGHVANRDILVTTIAAMIGAAIAAMANILQFSMFFGGDDDDNNPLGIIGVLVAVIVAPLAAMILQLAVSRQREYLADATAAQYLGEGRPLAEALATLQRGVEAVPMKVNPATEALYIANPLSGRGAFASLFSTHPPMEERIRRLRELDAASGIHY